MHRNKERAQLRELLRQLRLEAGLRQVELAKLLKKPQSYVSKYESGERRLDFIEVRDVCAAIGTSMAELLARYEQVR